MLLRGVPPKEDEGWLQAVMPCLLPLEGNSTAPFAGTRLYLAACSSALVVC